MLIKKYIKYIYYISSRPLVLYTLIILLTALSYPILNIHTDNDGKGWLPGDSKKLVLKNLFQQKFGSDEIIVVYLTFPDTSTKSNRIKLLSRITDSVTNNLYGFEDVFSDYNIEQLKHIMGTKYANRMEKAYFNPKDSLGEIIFFKQKLEQNIIKDRPLLLDSLQTILTEILPPDIKINITGTGVIFDEINRLSTTDSILLFSVCFFLIIILLWWQVRKFSYLLMSLGLVSLAIIPSLSLFGWLDVPFNMITMTVPLLFAINFSSYAIHFITKQTKSINKYIINKIPPVFTSALASIIGFGSLSISNIKIISQFGILTSLGILVGLIVILFVGVPLTIRLININKNILSNSKLNTFLENYYKELNHTVSVIIFFVVISVSLTAIIIFPEIKVDTNMIHFMKPDNKVRKSVEYIQNRYGTANLVEMLISKDNNEKLTYMDFRKIHLLTQKLDSLPYVSNVVDYKLWLPVIARLSIYNSPLSKKISESFLTKDKRYSKITLHIPAGSVNEMNIMLEKIKHVIKKDLKNTDIVIRPAGYLPLYIEQMNTIVKGMLSGLALAVILILIVMIVLVRNLKLGLITILATTFPLFCIILIMRLLNIPIDVGTSIIFSVLIGMIADDALHIIWNYKQYLKQKQSEKFSVNKIFSLSVQKIIYPCMVTSVMFSVGFSVLGFSNMSIIENFGLLSTATIILAWISDFLFFPALLNIFYWSKSNK